MLLSGSTIAALIIPGRFFAAFTRPFIIHEFKPGLFTGFVQQNQIAYHFTVMRFPVIVKICDLIAWEIRTLPAMVMATLYGTISYFAFPAFIL
jgi:hypothetical protein